MARRALCAGETAGGPDGVLLSELQGRPDCCWTATAPRTAYPRLGGAHTAEAVIVGAGIVGVTAAYLLSEAGLSVALLEACRIRRQVTGRSTAKITTQHSLIYRHLVNSFGLKTAQRYADASCLGVNQIRQWVEKLGIACDFETKDAYVYCSEPSSLESLQAEADASQAVGLDAELLEAPLLPFLTAGALRSRNQAQFNPAQYLIGLAKAAEAETRVFEETRVTAVEESDGWKVVSGRASVHAKNVVLATVARRRPYTLRRAHAAAVAHRYGFSCRHTSSYRRYVHWRRRPTHSLRTGMSREWSAARSLGFQIWYLRRRPGEIFL